MAIDGIYMNNNTVTTSTAITGKGADELGMNDFMNLLVAQFSNQDMLNPVEDTEFISQLAMFSALQGVNNIQEYQLASYATSYAGKYVTIANTDEYGNLQTISGMVEAVSFYDGSPKVQVDGKTYDLYMVMEVGTSADAGTLSQAAQYIGKTVTVTYLNDLKEERELTGIVTSVTVKDNKPMVVIKGEEYPVENIKNVVDKGIVDEDDDD